jgi:hypothetical protein
MGGSEDVRIVIVPLDLRCRFFSDYVCQAYKQDIEIGVPLNADNPAYFVQYGMEGMVTRTHGRSETAGSWNWTS